MRDIKQMSPALIVGVASLGGGLEMYDFTIYIFLAPIISTVFFPKSDQLTALLSIFAVFAVGYLARPLGAFLFGYYGDRVGRRKGLLVSMTVMAAATVLIGFIPGHQHIGDFAPLLLVIFRMFQGVAVGGDLAGGITFVSEYSESNQRGLSCGWIYFGVNAGLLVGSLLCTSVTAVLSHQQLQVWGWRSLFWFSIVLLGIGIYFRMKVSESPIYTQMLAKRDALKNPIKTVLQRKNLVKIFKGIGITWIFSAVIAQVFLYMPSYLNVAGVMSLKTALIVNTASIAVFTVLIPVMGHLSDKLGRRVILFIAALGFLVLSYGLYVVILEEPFIMKLVAIFIFDVLTAMVVGTVPATLAELFATEMRYTGVAVAYNISFALFAGLTPMFATWLISAMHSKTALVYNLVLAALVCLVTLFFVKESKNVHLNEIA